jgi:hypothetical protein
VLTYWLILVYGFAMTPNPTQVLAGLILGEDLGAWVAQRRHENIGWDRIATDLALATGGRIVTTGQTLRRWYADSEVAA